jgi:DNA polymerase-4
MSIDSLQINSSPPRIMHIDLNSCFATVAQQAISGLRGKPLVIAAYATPNGCVIAPSIEAKKLGIRVGMRVKEAQTICPNIVVREPDPVLVRDVHMKFKKIANDYSPDVFPKSIDEVVIDFTPITHNLQPTTNPLISIGYEIKQRLRTEIGEWISCNVGIGANRFLAKVASSLHKPDGLDIIDRTNLVSIYKTLSLIDLPGINTRFEARLTAEGIFTPVDFLNTSLMKLKKEVFQSITGYYWYQRLRGWEVDNIEWGRKSFGQDYALGKKTADRRELSKLLMKLTEKMGRRLRKNGYTASGVHLGILYTDRSFWHLQHETRNTLSTTGNLYRELMWIFNRQPKIKPVAKLSVSCFHLQKKQFSQNTLFDMEARAEKTAQAADAINDRYGEFCITPALMMGMNKLVVDRIAFGGVKELEDLYR